MNGLAALARPRFILAILLISGAMVVAISLLHHDIAPAMLAAGDQMEQGDLL